MKRKRTIITSRAAAARTPKRALRDAAARTRATAAPTRSPGPRTTRAPVIAAIPEQREPVEVALTVDLAPRRGRLTLRTPIVVASGVFGLGVEAVASVDFGQIGAIVTRTLTRTPRSGNRPFRIVEVAGGGLVHSIGLQNPGVEAALVRFSARWANLPAPV